MPRLYSLMSATVGMELSQGGRSGNHCLRLLVPGFLKRHFPSVSRSSSTGDSKKQIGLPVTCLHTNETVQVWIRCNLEQRIHYDFVADVFPQKCCYTYYVLKDSICNLHCCERFVVLGWYTSVKDMFYCLSKHHWRNVESYKRHRAACWIEFLMVKRSILPYHMGSLLPFSYAVAYAYYRLNFSRRVLTLCYTT